MLLEHRLSKTLVESWQTSRHVTTTGPDIPQLLLRHLEVSTTVLTLCPGQKDLGSNRGHFATRTRHLHVSKSPADQESPHKLSPEAIKEPIGCLRLLLFMINFLLIYQLLILMHYS